MLKRVTIFSIIMIFILISIPQAVYALTDNQLCIFNNNVITKTTTVGQVNSMFGVPKITTESAFGGKAYTYYDDNYTWVFHIETNENGKIIGYGGISNSFESKRYKYGAKENHYFWTLSGTTVTERSKDSVCGFYEYNGDDKEQTNYWSNYKKDSSKYLYELQKPSIIVSKVLAKRLGLSCTQEAPTEDIFYMNEQLKENGQNISDYAESNGKINM